jgi:hypothetical protein
VASKKIEVSQKSGFRVATRIQRSFSEICFLLAIEEIKDIQEDNNFGNNEIERFFI